MNGTQAARLRDVAAERCGEVAAEGEEAAPYGQPGSVAVRPV